MLRQEKKIMNVRYKKLLTSSLSRALNFVESFSLMIKAHDRDQMLFNADVLGDVISWLKQFRYFAARTPVTKALVIIGPCASGKTFLAYEACRRCQLTVQTLSVTDTYEQICRKLNTRISGYSCVLTVDANGNPVQRRPEKCALIVDDVELSFKTRIIGELLRRLGTLGMPIVFTTSVTRFPAEFAAVVDRFRVQKPTEDVVYEYLRRLEPDHPLLSEITALCDRDLRQAKLLLACRTHSELRTCIKDRGSVPLLQFNELTDQRTNAHWTFERLMHTSHNLNATWMSYPKHVGDIHDAAVVAGGISDANLFAHNDRKLFSSELTPAIVATSVFQVVLLHRVNVMKLTWTSSAKLRRTRKRKKVYSSSTKKYKQQTLISLK